MAVWASSDVRPTGRPPDHPAVRSPDRPIARPTVRPSDRRCPRPARPPQSTPTHGWGWSGAGWPLVRSPWPWPHRRSSTCQVRLVPLPNRLRAGGLISVCLSFVHEISRQVLARVRLGVQCTDKAGDRWFAMWGLRWILTTG